MHTIPVDSILDPAGCEAETSWTEWTVREAAHDASEQNLFWREPDVLLPESNFTWDNLDTNYTGL